MTRAFLATRRLLPLRPVLSMLSVQTAEPAGRASGGGGAERIGVFGTRLGGGRLYVALGALAVMLAALSLLVPSTPSYDPWAWLVWGREIVHLNLHTTGGPSWKPLPVIFTTLFAPFGKVAPDLWLVVARAGALMSAAVTFKLAWRLARLIGLGGTADAQAMPRTGLARASELGPPLFAAVLAAGSLVASTGFISDNALGYSEGLMTALVLIAIDRHLDGERRQAFLVAFAAALDRPEIWVFWGLYGLYLWRTDPGARKLVVAAFALIPVLWFGPELWGSGHLLRGVNRAQHVRSNSAANASCPFCTELAKHAWKHVLLRIKYVVLALVVLVGIHLFRRRADLKDLSRAEATLRAELVVFVLGALGFGWWVLIAVMTQAGFSGNDRYLVLGAALIVIAGGVAWSWAAMALARLLRRYIGAAAGVTATIAVGAVFLALPPWIGANVVDIPATHRALVYQAHLRQDVTAVVRRAGGAAALLRCGTIMTEGFQVPMVAWTLGVHTLRIEASPTTGAPLPPAPEVIIQTRAQRHSHVLPSARAWPRTRYRLLARARTFRIYSACRR